MEMIVHRAGMQTTVQDLGRRGHRAAGVPVSGAMDTLALRVANALVGNPENTAALEFALVGPVVEFTEPAWVALGGAECEGLPAWLPQHLGAGERLDLGACTRGCRGYLAIAGGIDVPQVLGSRSTYLRGGFGGHAGRALRDGDRLQVAADRRAGQGELPGGWKIDPRVLPAYGADVKVRVVPGAQAHEFAQAWSTRSFRVSPQSDRMGLRLIGEPLTRSTTEDLLSAAVTPGTLQVPPDGQPVVLMADAQTIGGYPQLAHVIAADLPLVAQLRPGDRIAFQPVTLAEAHASWLAREHAIGLLKQGLAGKISAIFADSKGAA